MANMGETKTSEIYRAMTILLLGATGRTGAHVLELLLKEGYKVHAVVRDKTKIVSSSPALKLIEGNTTDRAVLREALAGCDRIISVLNVSRKTDFPWSKLRTPKTLLSDTMSLLLQVADPQTVQKIVICSAWGAGETKADIPGWFRWLIDNSNIGAAYKDHEWQETLLKQSAFDYTIVRPAGLTNRKKQQTLIETVDNHPKPRLTVSRRSLAGFIVRQLSDTSYSRKAVTISAS